MSIRLVLADDHPIILNGLENLFRLEEGFDVLASCADGVGAMQAVRQFRPDVAVLDISMPGMSGLEVARKIREEKLPTRVVLLTAALKDEEMLDAVHLEVNGIVLKEMAPQFLVQCIRKVHAGEQWIERRSAKQVLEKMLRRETGEREAAAILTPREIELVRMVARGLRNKDVADKLCISEGTVKVHLHNIYEKLNVDGRMALLRYAQEKGLV
ncbi:MAG TPA: response regulator transcription factor [Nitrospirota bacterium]|nr:response regulator transcription factor [Nitrospirota bacterium]